MKYIDANFLRKELQKPKNELKVGNYYLDNSEQAVGYENALNDFELLIDSLQQEQPKLTQVPRIEQETQKKGWMNYGLLISEIGLHRSNAIDRIKETKERATEIKRNIAPHDLAILSEYLESAGAEIVLCCLQRYCMDFMFTQDEVKEIIQQEQPEVDIEKEINELWKSLNTGHDYVIVDSYSDFLGICLHCFELGINARKKD